MFLKENPKAELRIAGKGPLQPQLEALAAKLGVSERVRFCGFVSQSELMKLYASSHLFLHPSETPPDENQEGIPNSILEAMATGLPVVATYHGGIPEAVEHGRTGILAEERDAEALGSALLRFSRSPQLCDEFGYRANLSVRENFEQAVQTDQLEAHYDEAIELAAGRVEAISSGVRPLSPQVRRGIIGRLVVEFGTRIFGKFLVIRTKPALISPTQAPRALLLRAPPMRSCTAGRSGLLLATLLNRMPNRFLPSTFFSLMAVVFLGLAIFASSAWPRKRLPPQPRRNTRRFR